MRFSFVNANLNVEVIIKKRDKIAIFQALIPALLLVIFSSAEFHLEQNKFDMEETITLGNMPIREGVRPKTTDTNPHTQLTQQPEDLKYIKALKEWAFSLNYIQEKPSSISVPGAVAMCMEDAHTCDGCNAFMVGTEFAHFHPHPDYSMHLGLPKKDADLIIINGWGEWHPLIERGILPPNIIMMYAPRNQEELEVAKFIVERSYQFAQGKIQ